jgi:hypothetical protein
MVIPLGLACGSVGEWGDLWKYVLAGIAFGIIDVTHDWRLGK